MIRGVVFDMDGLMLDTERIYNDGWHIACSRLGYDLPEEVLHSFVGLDERSSRLHLDEYSHGTMDYDALSDIFMSHMRDCVERGEVDKKPGLDELLAYLRKSGRLLAVATSTESALAKKNLRNAGVEGYFDVMVFGEMVAHGKPAPDIYSLAASMLRLSPRECLALEDSPAGILSAEAAGLLPVMIPDCIQPDAELFTHLYAVKKDLSEVIGLLENGVHAPHTDTIIPPAAGPDN